MPMDSIDEMDMILMQPSTDKDGDELRSPKLSKSFSFFLHRRMSPNVPERRGIEVQLITNEEHGGYIVFRPNAYPSLPPNGTSGFHGLTPKLHVTRSSGRIERRGSYDYAEGF
jgi:hypothetical protein